MRNAVCPKKTPAALSNVLGYQAPFIKVRELWVESVACAGAIPFAKRTKKLTMFSWKDVMFV